MSNTILIAGQQYAYLAGIKVLIQKIIGSGRDIQYVATPAELFEKFLHEHIEILIMDTSLDGADNCPIVEQLTKAHPQLKVLIVSASPSTLYASKFMQSGAYGYVCTTGSEEDFITAFKQLYLGKKYFPAGSTRDAKKINIHENPFDHLTQKEQAVLEMLLEGKGVKEISLALDLKITTASTYKTRILNKLQVDNLMKLFNLAAQYNISASN